MGSHEPDRQIRRRPRPAGPRRRTGRTDALSGSRGADARADHGDHRTALGAGRGQPHRRGGAGVPPRAARRGLGGGRRRDRPGRRYRLPDRDLAGERPVARARSDLGSHGRGRSQARGLAARSVHPGERARLGFRPRRSIVVAYSGDEETTMKTSRLIAERLRNAHIVLNVDGASGLADEKTGAPLYWTWQGAEKTYIDFRLEATNAGGHSSTPR